MKALSNLLRGSVQNQVATRVIGSFLIPKSLVTSMNNDIKKPLFNTYSDMRNLAGAFANSSRTFSTKSDIKFFSYGKPSGVDVNLDFVFEYIFKNKEIIKNFLENVLIGDKKILPSDAIIEDLKFLPDGYLEDKVPAEFRRIDFDLEIKTNKGIFIVEMQKSPRSEYVEEFYDAIANCSQPLKKGPYTKMKEYGHDASTPKVFISILNEDSSQNIFAPEIPCISYYTNTEPKTNKKYIHASSYVFIDLQKFKEQVDIQEDLQDWLRFLKTQDLRYNYQNEQVKNAIECVDDIYENKYDIYIRHLLTEQGHQNEKQDAEAAGEAKGKAESSTYTILELLDTDLPAKKIAKAAGITVAQLNQITAKEDKSPKTIIEFLLQPNNQIFRNDNLSDDLGCLGEKISVES